MNSARTPRHEIRAALERYLRPADVELLDRVCVRPDRLARKEFREPPGTDIVGPRTAWMSLTVHSSDMDADDAEGYRRVYFELPDMWIDPEEWWMGKV